MLETIRIAALAALLAPSAAGQDTPLVPELTKLLPTTGQTTALFGLSAALDGDTLAVGAPGEAGASGAVWVFEREGDGWSVPVRVVPADPETLAYFGHSVDVEGDTLAVGAWQANAAGVDSGAAYVFARDAGGWTQQAKLVGSDTAAEDLFGSDVGLAGDTLVVGAWWHDTNGLFRAGQAYVFERSGTTWTETQVLAAKDADATDRFGYAIDVDGNRLAVGAWNDSDQVTGGGAAYVFEREASGWTQIQKLAPDDPVPLEAFGFALDLRGDLLAIGTSSGNHPGATYVFGREPAGWVQDDRLTASDGVPRDDFGMSVAWGGDLLFVGAGGRFVDPPVPGTAYRFAYEGGVLTEQARLVAGDREPGDQLGISVAADGDRVVVGADFESELGDQAGAAYVFGLEPGPGTNYCTNVANSSGDAAWMSASGAPSPGESSFALHAMGAPPGVFGLFFHGADAFELPFGDGTLCVSPFAPGLVRLPVVVVGPGGHAAWTIDWDVTDIQAGETRYFQFWFRDNAAGGAGWNLSDGLAVIFED